jgi:small subunit ribosomal protein S19
MVKKEFTYYGRRLDELKTMSLQELSAILPARARRCIKRGFTPAQKSFLKRIEKKNNVKTHCRDMIILPVMVGKTVRIYNGKEYFIVLITEEMIGHYIGEFSMTRKRVQHSAPGIGATKSSASISVR